MASHYKLYDGLGEVVPFNAKYSYPTQANRAWKQNIKIPATNPGAYRPGGSNIQLTLPAQGYLNTRNSFFSFDIKIINDAAVADVRNIRFQNNIKSVFSRMQLRYGSLTLEDLRETGPLERLLIEAAGTNTSNAMDQNSIAEGIGGYTTTIHNAAIPIWKDPALNSTASDATALTTLDGTDVDTAGDVHVLNVRNTFIQSNNYHMGAAAYHDAVATGQPRTYHFQIPVGLFQQNKLLPLKWMASQLTLEFTLADPKKCMVAELSAGGKSLGLVNYEINNFNFNAELLEFDGSYDAAFLEGLRGDGVPIKFSTWDTFMYTPTPGGTSQTLQIPERNRSLKAAFVVQIPPAMVTTATGYPWDSHALLHSSNGISTNAVNGRNDSVGKGHITSYQWRIGGKYYPAQPVACGNGTYTNGGSEAYRELEKALNIVGDYRLSTGLTASRWCPSGGSPMGWKGISRPYDWPAEQKSDVSKQGGYAGPSAFAIALDLETSSGAEVSGLNGEEQNDLSLTITYSDGQSVECQYLAYIYYDSLLVLRENNLVELIK